MQINYFKIIFILVITIFATNYVYAEGQSHDVIISGIDTPNTYEIDVPSIYDIDIKWDNMKFTFVEQEKYKYNESNHTYKRTIEKYWSSTTNNININNKSSKNISINLKFETLNANIAGNFSKNNFNIKPSEEQNIKINLTGNLDNSYNEYKTVGNISIVIS